MQDKRDPNIMSAFRMRKFRHERNFWLASFTLASWIALPIIYAVRGVLLSCEICLCACMHALLCACITMCASLCIFVSNCICSMKESKKQSRPLPCHQEKR